MTCYKVLKKLEWSGPRVPGYYDAKLYPTCLVCGQSCEFGHGTNCELDAVLKRKTVEVEIPEPKGGFCHNCCIFLSCELRARHKEQDLWVPGPGCPWYEP